ncbi:uncharacterized protein [Rutidosis leptorrhynchoides]|uniref:uncharacterized protein n=1 Tax=Rutidosis leptorrhynchoides TaxID=125765 RepID=UPI003A9A0116
MPWVKWDKILAPFDRGGLNVGILKAFNISLFLKWRWRYLLNPDDLWVAIIKSIHGNVFEKSLANCSSSWSSIVKVCTGAISKALIPADSFKLAVGNGRNISFWHGPWRGNIPLSYSFNRLYHLDVNQDDTIADKLTNR